MQAAVFLDRDGTIIEDRGHLGDPRQVAFFPETFDALRRLQRRFVLLMITNQPGVAGGIISRQDVDRVNEYVVRTLADEGVTIADVFVCPHSRDDCCRCIKPNPYFLERAAGRHDIDLGRSFTVGDHPHDVELARGVGATGIYVLTGHGAKHRDELAEDVIVTSGIARAADKIAEIADGK